MIPDLKDENGRKDFPLIVSLWYGNQRWRDEATRLADCLEKCNLRFHIYDAGNLLDKFKTKTKDTLTSPTERKWQYRVIPSFLINRIERYREPIFFLHVDSVVNKVPRAEIFEGVDVGYCVGRGKSGQETILASPLFFRPGKVAYAFLKTWNAQCRWCNHNKAEHYYLAKTIKLDLFDSITELPAGTSSRKGEPSIYY